MELFLMCIIFVYTNLYNISDSFSIFEGERGVKNKYIKKFKKVK